MDDEHQADGADETSCFDFNPDMADSISEEQEEKQPEPTIESGEQPAQGDIFDQLSQVVHAPKLTRLTPTTKTPRFRLPAQQLDFTSEVADSTPIGTNPDIPNAPRDPDGVARFPLPQDIITTPYDQCPKCFHKFTEPFYILGNVLPGMADQMIKNYPVGTRQIPDPWNPGKIRFVLDKDPNDPRMLALCGNCGYDTTKPYYYECGHCHGTTTFRPKIWDYVCHHCGYSGELMIVLTDEQYNQYTTKEAPLVDQLGKKVYGPLRVLDSVMYNALKPEQIHVILGAEWYVIPEDALKAYNPDTPSYILFALNQSWLEAPDFDDLEIPLFEVWKLNRVAKTNHRFSWEDGFSIEKETRDANGGENNGPE